MSFGKENVTFEFTMRVPDSDAAYVDDWWSQGGSNP